MVDDINKFEIAQKLEELKEELHNPEVSWFDFPQSLYDEIMNMPKDKDGGVPKYYLSDGLKSMLSVVEEMKKLESALDDDMDLLDDDMDLLDDFE